MKVVILHGWGHNQSLWVNMSHKLGNDGIVFNMPGFGDEPLIRDDWGVPDYAKWVEKKISKYNDVVILGHSFGGRVAAEIASKNNPKIRGAILTGAPCIYHPTPLTQIKILVYKTFKLFLPKNLRKAFYSNDLKQSGKMEKIFRNVVAYDQTKQLKKISVPVLLIWGENDKDVPLRIAKEIDRLIKNSELKIIENAGHNTFLDNPNLFYGYAQKFISNL